MRKKLERLEAYTRARGIAAALRRELLCNSSALAAGVPLSERRVGLPAFPLTCSRRYYLF